MRFFQTAVWVLLCFAALNCFGETKRKSVKAAPAIAQNDSTLAMDIVSFHGESQVLQGYFYKPRGNGPFPAILFIPDIRKSLGETVPPSYFDELAKFWVGNGYILFVPDRREWKAGKDKSTSSDTGAATKTATTSEDRYMEQLRVLHKDVEAATEWLKAQPNVDENRIVLMGTMIGATHVILAADRGLKASAFIPFSPGSVSWNSYPTLQATLRRGIRNAKAPIFLIQTQNDKSLAPSAILGQELSLKGPPNRTMVYPPFGVSNMDARSFAVHGVEIWGEDALLFLKEALGNAIGK